MEDHVLEGYRLSPQQERVRLLARGSPAYRSQYAVAINGAFPKDALIVALQHLVDRHEILRTSFRSPVGLDLVLQVIADSSTVPVQEIDLSGLDLLEQDLYIERAFEEELKHPFDLEQGMVVHACVFTLSPDRTVLLLAFPAICADTWSIKNSLIDLTRAFEAKCHRGALPSDDVVQYADFAQWQNELLESEEAREGAAYWNRVEAGSDPILQLPFERDSIGDEFKRSVLARDVDVLSKVDALADVKEVATPVVLLACWQTLLWRMTGHPKEVVVDVSFDGRKYEFLLNGLGCFGQYLPLQCRFGENSSFDDILQQVHDTMLDAYRWQEFFPRRLETGAWENPSGQRFGFAYEEWPAAEQVGDVTFEIAHLYACAEQVKLELLCFRRADVLDIQLRYDPSVYSRETIEQLSESFQTLLESAVARSDAAVSALGILSDKARQDVLTRWNQTSVEYNKSCCIHELFEQQVERTPNAVAVTFEQEHLTYRQLNQRANQLAHYLRRFGVEPEMVVGLLVERSVKMIVALLGILKAGAAYLPLEPTLPKARMGVLLREAGVKVLVTQATLRDLLPNDEAGVTCVDFDSDAIASMSREDIRSGATDHNLAYVMFTSGSTGTPKGVAVEHRQLVNYVNGVIERLDLIDANSFATVSTIGADLANTAIYPSLCTGAELHVVSWERASDASAIADYFAQRPIDCLKIVPSHLAALVAASSHPERVLPRKRLVLGGEVLTWGTMRVFRSHAAPECRLFNHYGPTETTVGVVACDLDQQDLTDLASTVPLGYPLANTQIYLLDANLQPVPIGVPGQVHVGGANLARGYINHPELTADRFIPNPFAEEPGSRLYKTGDVARYLPDGAIEFLGRIDRQVKFHGYRIELGEIESVLRKHPAVRESAAVISGESGTQRLVAYVVNKQNQTSTIAELTDYLKSKLPEFMVPSRVVLLDTLPLTPNGKIDHRALPSPEQILATQDRTYMGPHTPTEEILAGVFTLMLGVDQVARHDDFFEIGGHSLLATRLLSRSRDVFNVELSLRSVFESPTVAGIGAAIDTALRAEIDGANRTIPRISRDKPLPLSFAQERMWDQIQLAPHRPDPIIDIVLRLMGHLDLLALERAINEIVRRHEVLRTTFAVVEGRPVQVISNAKSMSIPIDDNVALGEPNCDEEAREWATAEARQPFDLTLGPMMRARLLRLCEKQHILVLTMHPLVSDACSRVNLIRELAALYSSYSAEEPSPLADPVIQYADFAAWQKEWMQGERLERHLTYWNEQLEGIRPLFALSHETPVAGAQNYHIARQPFALSQEATAELKEVSKRQAVTLHMLLLAAWQMLLCHYTDQKEIAVAVPSTGRTGDEMHDLIGLCANTLIMRTNLSGDPAFAELLGRVREVVLRAYTHQDLPFDKLAENLHPEVQVMLAFENPFQGVLSFGDLKAEPLLRVDSPEVSSVTANFDLILRVADTRRGLEGTIEYNTALFEDAIIERIVADWQDLLKRITTGMEQSLSSLRK